MFNDEVMRRFKKPNNAVDLQTFNGRGTVGEPGCSDVVEIKIQLENGRITKACFKVFGCPGVVSATDVFLDMIQGKTIKEALRVKEEDIARALGGLPLESMHCTHLPTEALRKAIEDYKHSSKNIK